MTYNPDKYKNVPLHKRDIRSDIERYEERTSIIQGQEWIVKDSTNTIIFTSKLPEFSYSLPNSGNYQVEFLVRLENGKKLNKKEKFEYKNYFILCFGDSIASGEGNPDKVRIPKAGDKMNCNATTAKMIFEKMDSAGKFWDIVEDRLDQLMYLDEALDGLSSIKDHVERIKF